MKFVALVSGGKDSCYNIIHCLKQGHELVALANLHPADTTQQELDSFMFQTVGHDIISLYEQCTDLPLFRHEIKPKGSKNVDLNYVRTNDDEIEDLLDLLSEVKKAIPDLEAVSVGAILSSYQRTRVEDVCNRLDLIVLAYLWQRNQLELMTEMCCVSKLDPEDDSDCKLDARLIKVAAIGLNEIHLGKSLPQMLPILKKLNSMYDVHICGEGGEFETIVLDAPFFRKGKLELLSKTDDLSEKGNVVFNTRLNVKFKERLISDNQYQSCLDEIVVPSVLEEKWKALLKVVQSEVKMIDHLPLKIIANPEHIPASNLSINQVNELLYISNILPTNISGSVEAQSHNIFDQLDSIMKERKLSQCQILSTSLYLSDMGTFTQINAVYNEFFDVQKYGPLPPSRSCVGSNLLPDGCSLQLSLIFDTSSKPTLIDNGILINKDKNGLHVQGRSFWAPCNIGPYSQAIWKTNDRNKVSYISGQIALMPATMEMSENDPSLQTVIALRHFSTLKETISADESLISACFITDNSIVPFVSKAWSLYCSDMAYESDLWMNKCDDPKDCLCIVKVSELPRNALCEWNGIACDKKTIYEEGDEEEEEEEGLNNEISGLSISRLPHTKGNFFGTTVNFNKEKRNFSTAFVNSSQELFDILHPIQDSSQITLYCNPSVLFKNFEEFTSFKNINFNPIISVYDYNGTEHMFGLHIIS